MSEDFLGSWRERLASGSKLAAKALATAVKDDPSRLPLLAPLANDPVPTVRVSFYRFLNDLSGTHPALVAPFAREVVQGLAAPETDAQENALAALANVAPHAAAEVALALPLVAECLQSKRPNLRDAATRCLGRLGAESPHAAPAAARRLCVALAAAKGPRMAPEAREILAAIEGLVPNLPASERSALSASVTSLRGHPNLQVRERAGRLSRLLAA